MSKPNNSTESIAQHFSEINQLLKEVHNRLDWIQSQPYIPSIRQNNLAHLSDKIDNLQSNMHAMANTLIHLG